MAVHSSTAVTLASSAFFPAPPGARALRLCLRRPEKNKVWRVRAMADRDDGEESPESLFMKELKRRGLNSTSSSSASTETKTKQDNVPHESSVKSSREWTKEQNNQLKRSMALNSEGLDGLIPRAVELIKLGTTFFLALWPLILAVFAISIVIYWYFGSSLVHPGNITAGRPPYVDPYQLLEEENISQDLVSSVR